MLALLDPPHTLCGWGAGAAYLLQIPPGQDWPQQDRALRDHCVWLCCRLRLRRGQASLIQRPVLRLASVDETNPPRPKEVLLSNLELRGACNATCCAEVPRTDRASNVP